MKDSRHGAELAAAILGENFDLRLEEYVASLASFSSFQFSLVSLGPS
jgi:hypothetical protein